MSVVKDSGARAVLPPFGAEHEELRADGRALRRRRGGAARRRVGGGAGIPPRALRRCAELGFLGLKFPEAYGGQGGDHLHDAVWVEELARSGRIGRRRRGAERARLDRPAADLQLRHRGAAAALGGAGDRGREDRRAGDHRAGRRVRRRRDHHHRPQDGGGYVVNGSKTFITNGVRADFLVCACKTTAAGGHGGISFLVLEREMPGYEVARSWRSSAGTHPTPASSPSPTSRCRPRTCSARRTRASN